MIANSLLYALKVHYIHLLKIHYKWLIQKRPLLFLLEVADVQSTYICNSTSDVTTFVSQVQPYLYQLEYQIVVTIEGYEAIIHCNLLVGTEASQNITWQWTKLSTLIVAGGRVSFVNNNTVSHLHYLNSLTTDTGFYQCTATNNFGSYSRTVELRVKSKGGDFIFMGVSKKRIIVKGGFGLGFLRHDDFLILCRKIHFRKFKFLPFSRLCVHF